jgi:hypothetical protein
MRSVAESAESANTVAAAPDLVLHFRDADGVEWIAGAFVGLLERYERGYVTERKSIHSTLDRPMTLHSFTVVQALRPE